jgi:uncharacterized RDD family membrane protein YckC
MHGYVYAPLQKRLLAGLIDLVILQGFILLVQEMGFYFDADLLARSDSLALKLGIAIAYFVALESSPAQASLGKWLLGLRVMRFGGERLDPPCALLRFLAYLVCLLTLGLGFISARFTAHQQTAYDLLTDTVVLEV